MWLLRNKKTKQNKTKIQKKLVRNASNIKVNNKDKGMTPGAFVVIFEPILHFIVIIPEFEQINASLVWKTVVSDSKFVFKTVRNIGSYGLG